MYINTYKDKKDSKAIYLENTFYQRYNFDCVISVYYFTLQVFINIVIKCLRSHSVNDGVYGGGFPNKGNLLDDIVTM